MIPVSLKTSAISLAVLFVLWNLNGCARVVTQSRPAPEERPAESPPVPASVPEAPEEVGAPPPTGSETRTTIDLPPPAVPESKPSIEVPEPARSEAPEEVVRALPVKPENRYYVHVVRWEGETLSGIAEWYTGSWKNWEAIARANSSIDPERIRLGNRIQIPASLLKTREPMPREFRPVAGRETQTARPFPARLRTKEPDTTPVVETERRDKDRGALPGKIELFGPDPGSEKSQAMPAPVELFGPGEIAGNQATIPEKTELFGPVE